MSAIKPLRTLSIVGRPCIDAKTLDACPLYLSPVSAGFPSAAEDYIDSQINLHELIVRNPASTFFLRAAGDSMLGVGIHDGDLLIVDRSLEAAHNRVVIPAIDGELLVKKLYRKSGLVSLQSANLGGFAVEPGSPGSQQSLSTINLAFFELGAADKRGGTSAALVPLCSRPPRA